MAYSVLLASVPEEHVIAFRAGKCAALRATLSTRCSHLLAYWVRPPALRDVLYRAIDGGQDLRPDLWHPFRKPVWHPASTVTEIERQLLEAWKDLSAKHGPVDPKDWYVIEISKVLELFQQASAMHHAVVAFLERPLDSARAARVSIPLVVDDEDRVPL